MNISPGKRVPVVLVNASESDLEMLEISRHYLDFLAKTESIEVLENGADKPEAAIAFLGDLNILIPLEGLIDKGAEITRLEKAKTLAEKEISRLRTKIENPGFTSKAPESVVKKERQKLGDKEATLADINKQLVALR